MTDNELDAIIRLLDDPDTTVYNILEKKLVSEGIGVLQPLRNAVSESSTRLLKSRIGNISHLILKNDVIDNLTKWKDDDNDLLKGAWIVSKYEYPKRGYYSLLDEINTMGQNLKAINFQNFSPLEQIKLINHIFFKILRFSSSAPPDFFLPDNSYITYALENRTGNTITMAIAYMLLAQQSHIPLYGVNLPKNFILAYISPDEGKPLFYINPFNQGAVLNDDEIVFFLKQQNISPQNQFFNKCSNTVIIQRLLHNLKASYERLKWPHYVKEIDGFLKIFKHGLSAKIEWE